jgi:hypothetical protein
MLGKEFKSLLLKMNNDLKEDSDEQLNELRKSIQDLDEKATWIRNSARILKF